LNLVIETESLTKLYRNRIGCRNVTIAVQDGVIFGFLGPNGAGKSTFVKLLTGLLFPTSGNAFVLGKPAGDVETRRKIGYLPEIFKYQDWMTGEDLLQFHGALYKISKKELPERINTVLELAGLKSDRKLKIGNYSKGMQQRIGIASALLPDPELLFLDEPTSALDPIGRKEVREIMCRLRGKGKTVFLNSHLLSEVEMICDSVAFINKGTIVKQGRMDDILKSRITLDISAENIGVAIKGKLLEIDSQARFSVSGVVMDVGDRDDIHKAASIIIENGGKLFEMTHRRNSLEDVFVKLMEGGDDRC
jgi:ABC-2 type transport system ATP-binding protein